MGIKGAGEAGVIPVSAVIAAAVEDAVGIPIDEMPLQPGPAVPATQGPVGPGRQPMKIDGAAVLHATPERVWQAINDPTVLAGVIPGCRELNPMGENEFGLIVTLGVASIKGSYTGRVKLSDLDQPHSLTMRANGSGGPGTIDTAVAVRLTDNGDGSTGLAYDADAMVGGMVGGVGQRVLAGVAKKTAGQFFAAIDEVLTGARELGQVAMTGGAAGAQAAAGQAGAPMTLQRPAAPRRRRADLLVAAAFGALSMAVGVLIGARVSRADGPHTS